MAHPYMLTKTKSLVMVTEEVFDPYSLWKPASHIECMLEVEATMAMAQGELGIIPKAAAAEIASKANLDDINPAEIEVERCRSNKQMTVLTKALERIVSPDAAPYIHYGATTQNIQQTALTLILRKAHARLEEQLADLLDEMSVIASDNADAVCLARTNEQAALPITFGFRVGAWIEELTRQVERFELAKTQAMLLTFGGAVGAYHAWGDAGEELALRVGRKLGLRPVTVPSRAAQDHLGNYVSALAMYAALCGKIAREILRLQANEIGELGETQSEDVVGSSTMPHKVNPKKAPDTIFIASQLKSLALVAGAEMCELSPQDGGTIAFGLAYSAMEQVVPLASELTAMLILTMRCLWPNRERMKANVQACGEEVCTENLLHHLTRKSSEGRSAMYKAVKEAVKAAHKSGISIAQACVADDRIAQHVTAEELEHILDPVKYVGKSPELARKAAVMAKETAEKLREMKSPGNEVGPRLSVSSRERSLSK